MTSMQFLINSLWLKGKNGRDMFMRWSQIILILLLWQPVMSFGKEDMGPVTENEVIVDIDETPEEAGSEYSQKKNKILQLGNEIKTHQAELDSVSKAQTDQATSADYNEALAKMVDLKKTVREMSLELRQLKMDLKYRFPEKNSIDKNRKYVPVRRESIQTAVVLDDIDIVLSRFKSLVGEKYASFLTSDEKKQVEQNKYFRDLSSLKKNKKSKKKRLRLER